MNIQGYCKTLSSLLSAFHNNKKLNLLGHIKGNSIYIFGNNNREKKMTIKIEEFAHNQQIKQRIPL